MPAASLIHGLQAASGWRARIELLLGGATKVTGIWLTYGDLVLAGADFGVAFYLLLAALIHAWQYYRLGAARGRLPREAAVRPAVIEHAATSRPNRGAPLR